MIGIRTAIIFAASVLATACAPSLPKNSVVTEVRWLEQNWTARDRFWFHHASQGTATLPVPYKWFVALEQPRFWLSGEPPLLKDSDYLRRFGFIPSPESPRSNGGTVEANGYSPEPANPRTIDTFRYDESKFYGNPDGLPVGFARTKWPEGSPEQTDQIGFTCAACHTGHMEYNGVSLRIDGGAAMTDLGKLREVLGLALAYTKYVPFRFSRFADRLLGGKHSPEAEEALKHQLDELLEKGRKLDAMTAPAFKDSVEEGFTRLDALNRIGNRVFFQGLLTAEGDNSEAISNLAALSAPVNFPPIWDASWFEWVQYDASIMQPVTRNAGEALGVSAAINLTNPDRDLFASSVDIREVFDLERLLAGESPTTGIPGFKGLRAPKWPEDILGKIDWDLAWGTNRDSGGRALYQKHCQGCHLPAVDDPAFWKPKFWTAPNGAGESYLKLKQIPIAYVGTDPAQASVMVERMVKLPKHLEVSLPVSSAEYPDVFCTAAGSPDQPVIEAPFALALGVVVEKAAKRWYDEKGIDNQERIRMNGNRPNCLQAKMVYKARPLDGIWATAPFLHNGSVPNLYQLLSPVSERDEKFYLGSRIFKPDVVGYETGRLDGGFELDTSLPGNRNVGHAFQDGPRGNGTIGPKLSDMERQQLVEYLKSIGLAPPS